MRLRNGRASLELYRTPLLLDPFDSVAKRIENDLRRLIEYEVCKYKTSERLTGPDLTWKLAWEEWTKVHQDSLEEMLDQKSFSSE
jgi:hypothetical protein